MSESSKSLCTQSLTRDLLRGVAGAQKTDPMMPFASKASRKRAVSPSGPAINGMIWLSLQDTS
jgi:hypothetical protein